MKKLVTLLTSIMFVISFSTMAQDASSVTSRKDKKEQVQKVKADTEKGTKTKKDGTPDKRFKENKKLKKDGTPDKRFKENKK